MKISVVIPAHNRPALLEEAVTSVIQQTHADWELVIVDDGSVPPVSLAAFPGSDGGRFRLLRHETPQGVARAKNVGIRAATGEVVTLLDDDDLFEPEALAAIRDAFVRIPVLDCLFLGVEPFGPYAANPAASRKRAIGRIIAEARPTESDGIYIFDRALFGALLHSVPIDFQRPAARKGAWNMVGEFDESTLFSESGWAIKASAMCKVALTSKPLTRWRIHDSNFGWLSGEEAGAAALRQLDNTLASAKALEGYFAQKQRIARSQLEQIKVHLSEAYFSRAYYLRNSDKRLGLPSLLSAILVSPRPKHLKLLLRYCLPGRREDGLRGQP